MKIVTPKTNASIHGPILGTVPSKPLAEESQGVPHNETVGDVFPVIDTASVSALREFFELLDRWDRSHEKDSGNLSSLDSEHRRESALEHTSGGAVGIADRTTPDRVRPRRRLTPVL